MLNPFDAPRIKTERAKLHLAEFNLKTKAFFERGAVQIVFEKAEEYSMLPGNACAFTYRECEPIPAEWSAIIGDIIHNMRASLDLLASDVHRMTGGKEKDTKYVHYPFCASKSDLPQMLQSRRLSRIGKAFTAAIEHTEPYKGGNDGLRAIHDLDLLDKHQALVPIASVVDIPWPVKVNSENGFKSGIFHNGQRLIVIDESLCGTKIGETINAKFEVLFDVGVFRFRQVSAQLDACLKSVETIIDFFESVADSEISAGRIHIPNP